MSAEFTRRDFLKVAALLPLCPGGEVSGSDRGGAWVNDVHSQLNPTRVRAVVTPQTRAELTDAIGHATRNDLPISVSGCRHSMGGQQFATDGICFDTRALKRILSFDRERGLIEVEAGIQWPELMRGYLAEQEGMAQQWGIAQKQTGADNFTLGGSLGSNVHGRGLAMKPIISNVESFTLIDATGDIVRCSRNENAELFKLAIGGYGLFGVIATVTLRLVPRKKLQRVVELIRAEEVMTKLTERIRDGFLYGDFQFSIDENSPDFLQLGVLSCYQPVDDSTPVTPVRGLSGEQWLKLLHLAHVDRAHAFEQYAHYYLSTNGKTYCSDTHQLSPYLPDYATQLRSQLGARTPSTLMLSELYVPRSALARFLRQAAALLRDQGPPVIYGTVRLIERDDESFLAWARAPYACIIFNLLTVTSDEGIARSARAFRALIDLASRFEGSYYLTYYRFASPRQLEACYPKFPQFLALKRKYDPTDTFQSDWYRHQRLHFDCT